MYTVEQWQQKYPQISNISHQIPNLNVSRLVLQFFLSNPLRLEWRCSWSSANRRCSNYIWVTNDFIAYQGTTYIRCLRVVTDVDNGMQIRTQFPHYWPFVKGNHRSPMDSRHNGPVKRRLVLRLMYALTSCWTNDRVACNCWSHDAEVTLL